MDLQWWERYEDEIQSTFFGDRLSVNKIPAKFKVKHIQTISGYGNSGAGAISCAIEGGATRVIMLGYDCQRTNGKNHWHADYPKRMGNCGKMDKWHTKFGLLNEHLSKDAEIINASRESALDMFKRMDLESALRL